MMHCVISSWCESFFAFVNKFAYYSALGPYMAGSVLCGLCVCLAFDISVSIAQIRPTMINDQILLRKVNATRFF
jgi:hypothetical protein